LDREAMTDKVPPNISGYKTLYRLSIYIVILAWIMLGIYFYSVTKPEYSSAERMVQFFLSPVQLGLKFRALILLAPLFLTLVSYLIYDRANLFLKSIVAEQQLRLLRDDLIIAFANALDAKSSWTQGHSQRVTNYALMIAEQLHVNEEDRETLRIACLLHDIGKIGTYDVILDKAGPLTKEEWRLVKLHPVKAEEILKPIKQLQHVLPIIKYHHERMDGKGYPDGLAGEDIPLLAKILCLADAFDAMIENRPYKRGMSKTEAYGEIKEKTDTQFDAAVAMAFLSAMHARNYDPH
jgi:putative nucleotidyltransferase with HDIG domain